MNKSTELSFPSFFILQIVCAVYIAADHRNLGYHIFMLSIVSAVFILTYFTSLEMGLIFLIPFLTGTAAYHIYEAIRTGRFNESAYFWLIWPILAMISLCKFTKTVRSLVAENHEIKKRMERYITIDESTRLNNLIAFDRDAKVYMGIAGRYRMELILILWQMKNQDLIKKQLGEENMDCYIDQIAEAVRESLRREDLIYLVEKDPCIIGTLMFAQKNDLKSIIGHVKDKTERILVPDCEMPPICEMKVALQVYEGYMISPLAFLAECKIRLKEQENL